MQIVLQDLQTLNLEHSTSGRVSPSEGGLPDPLIWDESSNISRAATEADRVLEDVGGGVSEETAKMLAYALNNVEVLNSTNSLASDASKHFDPTAQKLRKEVNSTPKNSNLPSSHLRSLEYQSPHPTLMIDEHQPASSPPHYSPNPSQSLANRKRLNPSIPGQSPLSQERWHHERVKYGVSTATGESFLSPSRSPTKSRVSTSHGATKRGGALTHRKSTPSLPETRNPFRENEERQEPPAPLVGNHEASSCEEIWINNYASDVQRYSSVSLWADLAIAEAATLVDSQTLPANALAAMSAQLLVDMEPKFTPRHGQAVHDAVDDVLNSVFVLTDKDGKPTCEAAKAILERNVVVPRSEQVPHDGIPELDDVGLDQNELVLKHSVFSLGLQGSKKKLQLFMECPTYYDQVRYLWSNLKKEIVVRPPCHRKMQAMRAERQMETRMIKRACDHWAQGIIEVMFSAWKFEVSMSHAREKRGKYMLMMMQLKIGDVFKVWKDYTKENRTFREVRGARSEATS